MIIVSHQAKFDRVFPVVLGNREYRDQSALLLAMDSVIATSGMEEHLIQHFLEVASDKKVASVSGTDKGEGISPRIQECEHCDALFTVFLLSLCVEFHFSREKTFSPIPSNLGPLMGLGIVFESFVINRF